MSAIDPAAPLDTATASEGDDRLREERQWLKDLWTQFKVRHNVSGVTPDDPELATGSFKIPLSAPGTLRAGDMFFSAAGILSIVNAGAAAVQMGTIQAATKQVFRQTTAPLGWTRDASLTTDSVLRYLATGNPGTGGSQGLSAAFVHSGTQNSSAQSASALYVYIIGDHALRYIDVQMATKD